jgi:hypothetical protein
MFSQFSNEVSSATISPFPISITRRHHVHLTPITVPDRIYTPIPHPRAYPTQYHLRHIYPNQETVYLSVALLNKIQKPLLPGVNVWLLRYTPPKQITIGMHITGSMGAGDVERIWTVGNGYVVFLCSTIFGTRFLLAVPQRWTQEGQKDRTVGIAEAARNWLDSLQALFCA